MASSVEQMGRKRLSEEGTTVLRVRLPLGWYRWILEVVAKDKSGWGFSVTVRDMLKKGMRSYGWKENGDA